MVRERFLRPRGTVVRLVSAFSMRTVLYVFVRERRLLTMSDGPQWHSAHKTKLAQTSLGGLSLAMSARDNVLRRYGSFNRNNIFVLLLIFWSLSPVGSL